MIECSELLRLCGFDESEIASEKYRVQKAFRKIGLGVEDIKTAEDHVKRNHSIDLIGVQKLLGAWLKEMIDLILAKEEGKKVAYYGFPTIMGPGMSIALSSEEIYCSCPDVVLCHSLGHIFNKLTPVLEAGEKNGLPPGHALCTLQTIRVGGLALGIIPVPDMVLTSSYYCDMGSKTDELLHDRYGHQAIYIDGCMDSAWGDFPGYDEERVLFLGKNLNMAFERAGEILGTQITWNHLEEAAAIGMEYMGLLGRLSELMKADPLPVSGTAIELGTFLITGCTGRSRKEGPPALRILIEEVRERVKRGIGVVGKGAPRVLVLLGHFSDPTIERLYEEAGLADAAMLFSLPVSLGDYPETKYKTMGEVLAEREMRLGWYHSSFGFIKRAEQILKQVVDEFKIDGIIWNYTFNCRPMAQTSHFAKKWLEDTTGLPVLSLEVDYYDSRFYGTGALRTRVETFAQMLKSKKIGRT
jgi:hypothetical protein